MRPMPRAPASGTPGVRPGLRGFSLLEVLVALLVLAIGLLGLAALQARGVKFNHEAYARSQATYLAYEIMDLMRANRARAPQYVTTKLERPCDCDPLLSTNVANDLCCWTDALEAALPSGSAVLTQTTGAGTPDENDDRFEVTIRWLERGARDARNESECTQGGTLEATRAWDKSGTGSEGLCLVKQTWTFDQVWRP